MSGVTLKQLPAIKHVQMTKAKLEDQKSIGGLVRRCNINSQLRACYEALNICIQSESCY